MLSVTNAEYHYAECHYILAPFESAPFYIENTLTLCAKQVTKMRRSVVPSLSLSVSISWLMLQTFLVLKCELAVLIFWPNHRFKRI